MKALSPTGNKLFFLVRFSLFSDLRNLSGTTLMNLLAALFMTQLLYVIGVGGVPVSILIYCIPLLSLESLGGLF